MEHAHAEVRLRCHHRVARALRRAEALGEAGQCGRDVARFLLLFRDAQVHMGERLVCGCHVIVEHVVAGDLQPLLVARHRGIHVQQLLVHKPQRHACLQVALDPAGVPGQPLRASQEKLCMAQPPQLQKVLGLDLERREVRFHVAVDACSVRLAQLCFEQQERLLRQLYVLLPPAGRRTSRRAVRDVEEVNKRLRPALQQQRNRQALLVLRLRLTQRFRLLLFRLLKHVQQLVLERPALRAR
mmetsp:Transcript_33686/g.100313  ORF Transcript_33686/g.100313 Transcript_33686/m.100313 type:complete len:242 (-) Transcript_33686:161-886(-)